MFIIFSKGTFQKVMHEAHRAEEVKWRDVRIRYQSSLQDELFTRSEKNSRFGRYPITQQNIKSTLAHQEKPAPRNPEDATSQRQVLQQTLHSHYIRYSRCNLLHRRRLIRKTASSSEPIFHPRQHYAAAAAAQH
jgi:hypothetical protein